ncbi:MAG TPA: GNAT family N-acetyltransferase [Gammaproteobacteria bacterium]|nr:GNAT family N-acetyltransferase [Gammaproteobacteria bacterium]
MNIREASEEDLEAVAQILMRTQDLHAQASPERYSSITFSSAVDLLRPYLGRDGFWVVIKNSAVLGYAIAEYKKVAESKILRAREYCYLHQIGVAESSRGKGAGKLLIEHLKEECAKRGVKDIELDVWNFNSGARLFFQSCGFELFASKMRISHNKSLNGNAR